MAERVTKLSEADLAQTLTPATKTGQSVEESMEVQVEESEQKFMIGMLNLLKPMWICLWMDRLTFPRVGKIAFASLSSQSRGVCGR